MPLITAASEPHDFQLFGAATFATASGRFDPTQSRGYINVNDTDIAQLTLPSNYSDVYIRAQFSLTGTSINTSTTALAFRSGTTNVIRLYSPSVTQFRWDAWNGSSWVTLASTSTNAFVNTAITYPVFIRCNPGTSGNLSIQIGENPIYFSLSYSGNTTYTGTISGVTFGWFAYTTLSACWSAIIVADENCWDWRMAPLTPNANGAHTAWTGDYTDIDEPGLTEDSIYSGTAGARESFGAENVPGAYSNYPVKGVVVSSFVRRSTSGPQNMRHSLRIGGTDYDSALLNPDTLFATRRSVWTTNPATSNPFTTAEVDALEIGVVAES